MTPVWVTVTCASNSCYLKKLKMYETPSFHPGKTLRSLKKWLRAQTCYDIHVCDECMQTCEHRRIYLGSLASAYPFLPLATPILSP